MSPDLSAPASGDLSAKQYYPVKINSSGQLATCADGEHAAGILQNKPAAAGRAGSYRRYGESWVVGDGSITAGDYLAADSSGYASTATSGDEIFAQALETNSTAGALIRCVLMIKASSVSS